MTFLHLCLTGCVIDLFPLPAFFFRTVFTPGCLSTETTLELFMDDRIDNKKVKAIEWKFFRATKR